MVELKATEKTRLVEEKMARLFSEKRKFSEHLFKWEDNLLPDKYDHNSFEYSGQPSKEEFQMALNYQRELGANFIKLEGDEPLADSFELEAGIIATMVLTDSNTKWKTNDALIFKTPPISELQELEVKHYGSVYGEDFCRRNMDRQYDKFKYHGAYLGNELVGVCHSYTADIITCIDGLLVDDNYRKQYVATSLISHIRDEHPDTALMLHADVDDTPKDMYLKMGFEIVDKLYEYSCQDISKKK